MWQMTLLRIVLMLCIGVLLYTVLLHVGGKISSIKLKRRKRTKLKRYQISKDKIIIIYFLMLVSMVLISFLYIKFNTRGKL